MVKFVLLFLTALIHISTECNIIDYNSYPPAAYFDAIETCAMDAGQLIVPINADEVDFLKQSTLWAQPNWVGIYNTSVGWEYVTLDGDKFIENDILQWEFGFPNSLLGTCGKMQVGGLANDDCDNHHRFVCKKVTFGRFMKRRTSHEFRNAVIICAQDRSQLMSPRTWDEFNTMMEYVYSTNSPIWLGIHDKFEEGNFIDLDGLPVFPSEFLRWAPGRPTVDPTRNCVELHTDGLLYDMPCNSAHRYICNQ